MAFLPSALPLIQAPMAGVQDARLAIATSRAGGLGSLPAAMLGPDALEAQLRLLQDSGLPYNVNFFTHTPPAEVSQAPWLDVLRPYYEELGLDPGQKLASASRQPFGPQAAELLERFRPAVVSFHFGLPEPALLDRVRRLGARILSSATTLPEALWLQERGADAVIAQGLEAGGHRGHFLEHDIAQQCGTLELVARLAGALRIPVVAAGGMVGADDVRAAFAAGASAVQAGTAFLLCDEALTGPLHRARLADAQAPTELTRLFSGGLARGLVNRLMRELGALNGAAPPFPLASAALAPLRSAAEALGHDDFTPLWSGSRRQGLRAAPAAQVLQALAAGLPSHGMPTPPPTMRA
jgi:nitronate monooxygenase